MTTTGYGYRIYGYQDGLHLRALGDLYDTIEEAESAARADHLRAYPTLPQRVDLVAYDLPRRELGVTARAKTGVVIKSIGQ